VIENAVFAFKQPPTLVRHITVTCVVVALTVVVSLLTDCVGIVLELNVSEKKLKPYKFLFFMGKPSQNYGLSPKHCVTQFYLLAA